jgi:4-hydroxy-tetrahydrodipicolinate reductase
MVRVGIVGAAGRMGRAVADAVSADPDLDLVAAVDPAGAGAVLHGVEVAAELRALAGAGAQVVVDFTVADAARTTLPWLAMHGMHAVVGTTGFGDDDIASFRSAFTASNCVIAANFAIGAVLMMRFAEMAAPWFDSVEIVEIHHDQKVDAPSGTALETARRIASSSSSWAADPTRKVVVDGARGGRGPGGVPIHSLRVRGTVANQEVVFGTQGQTLTIRHDTVDRTSFMPGVVLACKKVAERKGVTLGLGDLLGL